MPGLIHVDLNCNRHPVQRTARLPRAALPVHVCGALNSDVSKILHHGVELWVDLTHAAHRGHCCGFSADVAILRGGGDLTGAVLPKGSVCHSGLSLLER